MISCEVTAQLIDLNLCFPYTKSQFSYDGAHLVFKTPNLGRTCYLRKHKNILLLLASYTSVMLTARTLLYNTCKLIDLHVISKIDPEETIINLLTSNNMEVIIAVGKFIKECNFT